MVARTGIEPVVFALKGQRVNRLHYRALFKFYHTVTASIASRCESNSSMPWRLYIELVL